MSGARQRRLREARKRRGECTRCAQPVAPGYVSCADCRRARRDPGYRPTLGVPRCPVCGRRCRTARQMALLSRPVAPGTTIGAAAKAGAGS